MDNFIQFSYVVAAALFIFGLKQLGSPATARRGNMVSAVGMLIAVVAALLDQGIVEYQWIAVGFVVGALIGGAAARMVEMVTAGAIIAESGRRIATSIDTICLHGDTPEAVAIARAVREALETAGITLAPLAR